MRCNEQAEPFLQQKKATWNVKAEIDSKHF